MPFFYTPEISERSHSYFAAANTKNGFICYFDELFKNYDKLIIKGGPGTGKSTLMKGFAKRAEDLGYSVKKYYCSSDTSSLDAVEVSEASVVLLDGTSPHAKEPQSVGARDDIVNLCDFLDKSVLKRNRERIEELSLSAKRSYEKVYSLFLSAFGIFSAYRETVLPFVDLERLSSLSKRLAKGDFGKMKLMQKNAIGKSGAVVIKEENYYFEHRYKLSDKYFISDIFLELLKNSAIDKGLGGSFSIEPLTITPASVEFEGGSFFSDLSSPECDRTINLSSFVSPDIRSEKKRLGGLHKMGKEVFGKALYYLESAGEFHAMLEDIYKEAMDFDKNEELLERLCERL